MDETGPKSWSVMVFDRRSVEPSGSANMDLVASFEAYTGEMFQVEVFWVVMSCSVTVGHQRFRYPCCLHIQGEETLVPNHNTTRRYNPKQFDMMVLVYFN